jgi:heptosyltransferase III
VNAIVTSLLAPTWVVGRVYTSDGRRMLSFLDDAIDKLHEEDWSAPDLLIRYAGVLGSRFIGEIFCRLARVETDFTRTEIVAEPPGLDRVPDVLVATGGTRSAKLWPSDYWVQLARLLEQRGLTVGLLGGSPAKQRAHYGSAETDETLLVSTSTVDLRGKLRLPQVAGALRSANACVTIDNGIMHLAYSVGTPTVAIFGASPWQLWAPDLPHLSVVLPPDACALCAENHFRNDACLRERHVCMESITPRLVLDRLAGLLGPRMR